MKALLVEVWFVGSGVTLVILGAMCLLKPNAIIKLDKALSKEVTRLDKLTTPTRLILGIGLVWIGIFLATLPRFLR